jgi:hypothetical protein
MASPCAIGCNSVCDKHTNKHQCRHIDCAICMMNNYVRKIKDEVPTRAIKAAKVLLGTGRITHSELNSIILIPLPYDGAKTFCMTLGLDYVDDDNNWVRPKREFVTTRVMALWLCLKRLNVYKDVRKMVCQIVYDIGCEEFVKNLLCAL